MLAKDFQRTLLRRVHKKQLKVSVLWHRRQRQWLHSGSLRIHAFSANSAKQDLNVVLYRNTLASLSQHVVKASRLLVILV